ncbi:DUF4815 domain-containing protein [Alteromonas sp. a30]|uniref:DUF4815 domain-containing protein n=1 Tax=Alteromonas sp. a30 TaxID=2730917 RepID=UPI00227FBF3E|nr:DUF4815 domain-containing protein [Alteromonas sp. a30]MCY7295102.1 DUF4815 domain-containing protein [Alteromonas sp. a30]
MSLDRYYKTYDPEKRFHELMFRVGNHLQGRELNDLQGMFFDMLGRTGNAIMRDGDVIEGGSINIDTENGTTLVTDAKVYIRGLVHNVPEASFNIALDDIQVVGIWLVDRVVTELDDPSLRDPAIGTESHDEPGAARREVTATWGLSTEDSPGNFYPVHRIDQGVQIINEPPPQLNAVTSAIARYDREANGGSYLVDGLGVLFRNQENAMQTFNITEGKAHIDGFEIALPASIRKSFAVDPDLQLIESEPVTFVPDAQQQMRIDTDFSPIHDIRKVDVAAEKTATITHGAFAGASDPLPDPSVVSIVSVEQAGTTYVNGTDFKLTGNSVDWSLTGAEPSPGSSYDVTYRYRTDAVIESQDENGLVISGAVANTDVFIDYQWKMPRIDLITIEVNGEVRKIKGVSHPYQPQAPISPSSQLVLATVEQSWRENTAPDITLQAIRAVSMPELAAMKQQIADLYQLLALERLNNAVNASTPASKLGVFVEPFSDDSLRDQGEEQTASIVDGELVLSIDAEVHDLNLTENATLDFELEPVIEQLADTGEMKINPYRVFEPVPARVRLSPAIDNWVISQSVWLSPITRIFQRGGGLVRSISSSVNTETRLVSQRNLPNLRPRSVSFTITGFGPGETLDNVEFDGELLPVTGV